MARLRRMWGARVRLLALAGLMMGTIGSCGMPNIKPPSL